VKIPEIAFIKISEFIFKTNARKALSKLTGL
jgi:hypothetical protein